MLEGVNHLDGFRRREQEGQECPNTGFRLKPDMAERGVGLWPIWSGMSLSFSLLFLMAVANGISQLAFDKTIKSFVDERLPDSVGGLL